MSESTEGWRREVEEVLAEIAADEKARLLRVPPVDKLLGLADDRPVGVQAPNLTKAERYLLQTHRQELAFLLRERCVMELCSDPTEWKWPTCITVDRDLDVPTPREWSKRVRDASAIAIQESRTREVLKLLDECVRVTPGDRVSVAQLALASQRVALTAEASVYVAQDRIDRLCFQEARDGLDEIRSFTSAPRIVAMCWQNTALSYYLSGEYHEAASAYRRSTLADPMLVAPPLNLFVCAVLAGDSTSASDAARVVDENIPSTHAAVEDVILACRASVNRSAIATMEPTGETSARVLDALRS